MMGTVWLRLGRGQDNIQPFINAIFFSGAFMSFMAVAYIPAYLEDHESFRKERANGLYGPTAFLLSNFLIGIPFICNLPPTPKVSTTLTPNPTSPNSNPLLPRHRLPLQLPPNPRALLPLRHVAIPRPPGGRVPRRANIQPHPGLCRSARDNRFCERALDVRWRLPRLPQGAE